MDAARPRIEDSLRIIELLRTKVASQDLRTSYFSSIHQQYEFYTDLLMRLHGKRPLEGFELAALEASERMRARSMLELLTESRANIRQGINPQLLERERSLQQLLNDKAEQQVLWNMECDLESKLSEPFDPNYKAILKKARKSIRERGA